MRLTFTHKCIEICIKRKKFASNEINYSDVKKSMFCLQIDTKSYEWGVSARTTDQLTCDVYRNLIHGIK